jgi:hypothetical protein
VEDSAQKRVMPLPELLGREGFEVREASGRKAYVDFTNKQFVVPFDSDPHAAVIRAHENMHVQITPRGKVKVKVEGAENRTMQAIEDCRVNAALRAVGIPTNPAPPEGIEERGIRSLASQSPLEQARALIGYHGRAEETLAREVVTEPWIVEVADEIISRFSEYEKNETVAPWSETIRAIEDLTRKFQNPPEDEEDDSDEGEESEDSEENDGDASNSGDANDDSENEDEYPSNDGSDEEEDGEDDEGFDLKNNPSSSSDEESEDEENEDENNSSSSNSSDDDSDEEEDGETELEGEDAFSPIEGEPIPLSDYTPEELADIKKAGIDNSYEYSRYYTRGSFQRMEIIHPSLTLPLPRPKTLSKRSSDIGSVPTQIHRLTSDGRIFRERGMGREGIAILFDVSGSMRISARQIDTILKIAPASVIATYQGLGSDPYNFGWLTIIAENKKRVSDDEIRRFQYHPETGKPGGENLIDGPAIEWLAKRKERRKIWITDGKVTGKEHPPKRQPTLNLEPAEIRRMAKVILEHKIEKIPSADEAIASISARKF